MNAETNKTEFPVSPKIRQIYWCRFWDDYLPPEMGKTRPVIIISSKNYRNGPCLIVPISTAPQLGKSAYWAHELSFSIDERRRSWVVCNHLYTVSSSRLSPTKERLRIDVVEFKAILSKIVKLMPFALLDHNP